MGKYTNLGQTTEKIEPQIKRVYKGIDNTNKHTIVVDTSRTPVLPLPKGGTNLRTTNLTNLSGLRPVSCVHGTTNDRCAVCSGYVRGLIAEEAQDA